MHIPSVEPVRTYRWRGIDDQSRMDSAAVSFHEGELAASGTSVCDTYRLRWSLQTDAGWVTRRMVVDVEGDGFSRSLELVRSAFGRWSALTRVSGNADLPEPGIRDAAALDNAQDVDLGLCPLTNTMPIRRLDLLGASAPADDTKLVMAWIDVPSLQVVPSEQVYTQVKPWNEERGHALVLFSATTSGFTTELQVDAQGVVLDYPGLAVREQPAALAGARRTRSIPEPGFPPGSPSGGSRLRG